MRSDALLARLHSAEAHVVALGDAVAAADERARDAVEARDLALAATRRAERAAKLAVDVSALRSSSSATIGATSTPLSQVVLFFLCE